MPDASANADAPAPTRDAGADTTVDEIAPLPNPRLDVLFLIDNSQLMDEKSLTLATHLSSFFRSLRAVDIHVGMLTSSLKVGNLCQFAFQDDKAHLVNRVTTTLDAGIVPGSEPGFLSFGPGGSVGDIETLAERTADLFRGAQPGCGIEAQLEAVYRFAFDPDPPSEVTIDAVTKLPVASGVDYVLLAQRKAFFRPDSTVAIILLTDEDDASIDLFSAGGTGHQYFNTDFPGSKVALTDESRPGFAAPRGTSVCAANPASPECTSCAFGATCDTSTAECQRIRNDSACKASPVVGQSGPGYDGFMSTDEDSYNLRAFDMKRRFGVEARFPLSRYVAALTGKRVPDRRSAHPESSAGGERTIWPYVQAETCANPLLSDELPLKEGDELCQLRPGPRTERNILFGLMAGTLPGTPGKVASWQTLLGQNPEEGNLSGIDPHMIPSIEPRSGLAGADAPVGDNGADPIHGREWRTEKADLQFACTYPWGPPWATSISCASLGQPCDCPSAAGSPRNPPLCMGPDGTRQNRGKAYPSTRELLVAKALGDRAVVASVCGGTLEYKGFHEAFAARINALPAP